MENDISKTKQISRKKVAILLGCVVIITIVATVLLLSILKVPTSTTNNKKAIAKTTDIMSAFSKSNAIPGLSTDLYQEKTLTSGAVNYKTSSHDYAIMAPTNKSLSFTSTGKQRSDDTENVKSQTKSLMETKGLKIASFNPDKLGTASYMTFNNDKIVCQLDATSRKVANNTSRYYSLNCIDKIGIEGEYTMTDKLLSIYKQSGTLPTFTKSVRMSNMEGSVAYSIIYLSGNKVHNKLLFAAVNDDWNYLGDLGADISKNSNSKYSITSELQAKINDPKYGDFLSKNIH